MEYRPQWGKNHPVGPGWFFLEKFTHSCGLYSHSVFLMKVHVRLAESPLLWCGWVSLASQNSKKMWLMFVTLLKKPTTGFFTQWGVKEGALWSFPELDPRCLWWANCRAPWCVTEKMSCSGCQPEHTFFQVFSNVSKIGTNFRPLVIFKMAI